LKFFEFKEGVVIISVGKFSRRVNWQGLVPSCRFFSLFDICFDADKELRRFVDVPFKLTEAADDIVCGIYQRVE
jgi:hypothetical protein